MTQTLFEARIKNILNMLRFGVEKVSEAEIKASARPTIVRLSALADQFKGMYPQGREKVRRELASYRYRYWKFDANDMAGSIARFARRLDGGPIGLVANGHGTVLVGFDKAEGKFIIRDSAAKGSPRYVKITPDKIFSNLHQYCKIEQIDGLQ